MLEFLVIGGTALITFGGYLKTRRFVRERLRFVNEAQAPSAPFIAGAAAALLAAPVVWLLPLVGAPTAVVFGLGVGWGVYHGGRDVRRQLPPG